MDAEKFRGLLNHISAGRAGSTKRECRVTPDEETAILRHLSGLYMAPIAVLAIETAMRRGELLALTWADVDLATGVARLVDTKNGEARAVPLSTRAIAFLKGMPRPIDDAAPVFPVSQGFVTREFGRSCKLAGVANLHFHDLRHEAVSRICEKLPMHEAMRVTGHKTPSMVMRYYR